MELFSSLLQWGKTGVLTVLTETEERGFLFYKGNLVYATSRDSARRLGAFLVRLGFISAEELKESLIRSPSGQGHFGQRLIDEGRITQRQLKAAVKAQIFDIFYEVLAWERGAFVFDDRDLPFSVSEGVLNSTQSLLLEAATRVDETAMAETASSALGWLGVMGDGVPLGNAVVGLGVLEKEGAGRPPGGVGSDRVPAPDSESDSAEKENPDFKGDKIPPELPRMTVAPETPSKILGIDQLEGEEEAAICEVLAHEPLLVAKVLKILSLTNVSLGREEFCIRNIVKRLGMFNTRCILLPEAARRLWFPRERRFWRECWEHDRICAHLCRAMAERIGYAYTDEAYLAGLLHNLGVYILYMNDPERYRRLVTASNAERKDIELLEKEAFGLTHTRIGDTYARTWKFPPALRMAIRDHHRVGRVLSRPLLHMTHVACRITEEYGFRVGFKPNEGDQYAQSMDELGLTESDLTALFIEARHRAEDDTVTFAHAAGD